ncbi:hypothetical protein G6F55_014535 [Rhizopus delemar]|nr:hypothetical protein G6F55_014535 [Rhizopus delemar]
MAKNEAAGQNTDYLSLNMPDETRNYVPKLQAIKNIIADPQRYAVALPPRHRPGNRRQAGRNAAGRIHGAEPVGQPPGQPW